MRSAVAFLAEQGCCQLPILQQWAPAVLGSAGLSSLCSCLQQEAHQCIKQARVDSGNFCSTSSAGTYIQVRSYAKKGGGGGGKSAARSAAASVQPAAGSDPLAPPEFKVKHVPQVYKGDPVTRLAPPQRALLEQLSGGAAPLRSLRQVGWPLGPKEVLGLWHEQLSQANNTNVYVTPFVLPSLFQSAVSLATMVEEYVEKGKGMAQVEQELLTTIANTAPEDLPFEGIKVQLKGRMSGKGGKASKKVWEWGRTSASNLADPVDYAHKAVVTRAGYIGIKVWVKYKRSHLAPQKQRSSRAGISMAQVLAMPVPAALPSRSSSAWWNIPAPLQPQQHQTWQAFKPNYDPLTSQHGQQQQQHQVEPPPVVPGALEAGTA